MSPVYIMPIKKVALLNKPTTCVKSALSISQRTQVNLLSESKVVCWEKLFKIRGSLVIMGFICEKNFKFDS